MLLPGLILAAASLCTSATLKGTPKEKALLLSGVSDTSLFGLFNSRAQLGSHVASPSFASSTVKAYCEVRHSLEKN